MSTFKELDEIRRQMKTDYADYMQAFSIQREANAGLERGFEELRKGFAGLKESSAAQTRALSSYQERANLMFDRIQEQLLDFNERITNLEQKAS